MSERVSLETATQLASNLIGLYPAGARSSTKGYIGALVQVLLAYPKCVVERVADPLKGVARESEYVPSPALLIAWCERETSGYRRIVETAQDRAAAERRMLQERAATARLELERQRRPTIQELKDKHGDTFGLDPDDAARRRLAVAERQEHANTVLRSRLAKRFRVSPDALVSPSLLRHELERKIGRQVSDEEFARILEARQSRTDDPP